MTDKEVKEVYARAEMEYEMLKDRCHDQYDEIQQLKAIISNAREWVNTHDVDDAWELLEILGDENNG